MKKNIYIIGEESFNRFKIGIGNDPSKRIKALQTGNPEKLVVIYQREVEFASKVETCLHDHYNPFLVNGEWFEVPVFSYSYFDKLVGFYENNFKILKERGNIFI